MLLQCACKPLPWKPPVALTLTSAVLVTALGSFCTKCCFSLPSLYLSPKTSKKLLHSTVLWTSEMLFFLQAELEKHLLLVSPLPFRYNHLRDSATQNEIQFSGGYTHALKHTLANTLQYTHVKCTKPSRRGEFLPSWKVQLLNILYIFLVMWKQKANEGKKKYFRNIDRAKSFAATVLKTVL